MSNELKIGSELKNGAIITGIQTRADGSQGMWIVTRPDGSTGYRPRRATHDSTALLDRALTNRARINGPDHPANPRYKLD